MNHKTIKQIYDDHSGKISDKWALYLEEWERLFSSYQAQTIRILEIGIQNGGSLEVWGKYFLKAEKIIGCDINPKCEYLKFDDSRISVIVGDANTDDCERKITELSPTFDIIIDDGLHRSSDIVRSFGRYFPSLSEEGLYVVEDLHASYWKKFEGGLYYPFSAMAFFKQLADIVNYEHWRNNKSRLSFLSRFSEQYGVQFDEFDLPRIHSIEFINSLCVIRKSSPKKNILGFRNIVGEEALVSKTAKKLNNTTILDMAVNVEDDTKFDVFTLIQKTESLSTQVAEKEQAAQLLSAQVAEKEQAAQSLAAQVAEKEQTVQSLSVQAAEKDKVVQSLSSNISEMEKVIDQTSKLLHQREQEKIVLQSKMDERELVLQALNAKLWEIYGSRAWRLIQYLWKIRLILLPPASWCAHAVRTLYKYTTSLLRTRKTLSVEKPIIQDSNNSTPINLTGTSNNNDNLISVQPVSNRSIFSLSSHRATVDIIVCVHNALADVRRCLESVIKYTEQPYQIIIVNDGSQDETSEYLGSFTREHGATLIVNANAHGYTRAANQGLIRSSADYTVLLNSDTIVSAEWLDRMCACIESDSRIGIVGPLSNTASWQSIPEIFEGDDWASNQLPVGVSIDEMAAMTAKYSARLYPEMALLNGFCLMFRRQVLDEIGFFDEDTFGAGYGEEDDYILRTRAKGWKLALADDVYIYHAQSKSYSHEMRKKLAAQSGKALADKHGQEIIRMSCALSLESPILEGIRARSRIVAEREDLIRRGRDEFSGKRVIFALPVALAGGGANVIFTEANAMVKMGIDVQIFNLESNRDSFHANYPDIALPITFGNTDEFISLAKLFDAAIATVYFSVEWLKPFMDCKNRPKLGYYVQGFEPLIYPYGSPDYRHAEASYTIIPNLVVFTKTRWTREQVLQHTGVECNLIGVSIDIDLFRPRPRDWNSNRPVVISAMIRPSTLYREPLLTMEVLKKISKIYGSRVEVKIFGVNPEEPDFHKLPLDFPWKLAGMLTPSQVAAFFNETDIFVDFSSHQAMGLTALEAMASGNAVIVPEIGGAVDYGRSEENCLIVNTLSFDACLNAVQALIDNRELFAKIQKNAIRDVCAYYPERSAYNILKALFPNR